MSLREKVASVIDANMSETEGFLKKNVGEKLTLAYMKKDLKCYRVNFCIPHKYSISFSNGEWTVNAAMKPLGFVTMTMKVIDSMIGNFISTDCVKYNPLMDEDIIALGIFKSEKDIKSAKESFIDNMENS